MNAVGVVLAAGFGTRLRPSTSTCPKPLIPVSGVEPLFHALKKLHDLGIQDAVVNAHYLSEKVEEALKTWQELLPGMNLHLSVEDEILGTGGAIQKILKDFPSLFQSKGLLLVNGDTLAEFTTDVLRGLCEDKDSSFAFSRYRDHLKRYKPLWIDGASSEWVGIGPTPPKNGSEAVHFLGIHYLSSSALIEIQKALPLKITEVDLFNGIYRPLADKGISFHGHCFMEENDAYSHDLYWFDMTNKEFLLEAQKFVMEGLSTSTPWLKVLQARYPAIEQKEEAVWVSSQNQVDAVFVGPVVFIDGPLPDTHSPLPSYEFGPYASIVCQDKAYSTVSEGRSYKVSNSVVFVNGSSEESEQKKDIKDEIWVI